MEIDGNPEKVHVKNTGRCKELLRKGVRVYLEKSSNPERKTAYDLVGVEKNGLMVNMDSAAPNKAAGEWLASGGLFPDVEVLRPECTYGNSRFDFCLETKEKILKIDFSRNTCPVQLIHGNDFHSSKYLLQLKYLLMLILKSFAKILYL